MCDSLQLPLENSLSAQKELHVVLLSAYFIKKAIGIECKLFPTFDDF